MGERNGELMDIRDESGHMFGPPWYGRFPITLLGVWDG